MRPKKFSWTLAAAHADGYLSGATGAGPWTTILFQPGDGGAHQVVVVSASDLHAITLTFVGTDADGRPLTESILGPNATTIYLTKYFQTMVSVTASATLGQNTMDVGWTALAYSPTYPVAIYPQAGPAVGITLVSGTTVYTKQQTNDNVFTSNPALWHSLGVENADVDTMDMALIGTTAVRLSIASHTSGVVAITISQARA